MHFFLSLSQLNCHVRIFCISPNIQSSRCVQYVDTPCYLVGCVTSVTKARPTADNCGWCQEGHPTVKTMPNLYDDDVTSLGYS